jgi:hypothetical protein
MALTQSKQTGSREILRRGAPQRRQSAGKNVKNKVVTARLAKPTNGWSAAWPWAARIRNPVLLLLKTASCARLANRSVTGLYTVSIAAVIARCNAAARLVSDRRLRRFTERQWSVQSGHCSQDISPPITMIATNGLQQQQRKQILFEEIPRPRAICLFPATSPATKLLEKTAS